MTPDEIDAELAKACKPKPDLLKVTALPSFSTDGKLDGIEIDFTYNAKGTTEQQSGEPEI